MLTGILEKIGFKEARNRMSIAFIVAMVLAFIVTIVLVVFASLFSAYERKTSIANLETKLSVYSDQLSKVLITPLWNFDNDLITDIIISQMNDQDIYAIAVLDADSSKNIQMRTRGTNWEVVSRNQLVGSEFPTLVKTKPIWHEKTLVGYVKILMTLKNSEYEIRKKSNYIYLAFVIIEICLILGIFLMLWQVVIKPVKKLEQYAVMVSSSVDEKAMPPLFSYYGELNILKKAITRMVEILNLRYQELQATETKFRNLFERTPGAIWLKDVSELFYAADELSKNGIKDFRKYLGTYPDKLDVFLSYCTIIDVNQASCWLFESPDQVMLIREERKLYSPTTMDVLKEGILQILSKHEYFESETDMLTFTGKKIYVILRWNLIHLSGQTQQLLVSINDITYQKKVEMQLIENERELKQSNEEYYTLNEELSESNYRILKINEELKLAKEKAEESDNLKTAFLCNMSHEIRTPLNAIVGFADLLANLESTNQKTNEYVSVIQNGSNQLLSIVNDILSMSRIQTGQEVITIRPVKLNPIFDNLYSVFKSTALGKKLEFRYHCANKRQDFGILTDETKLVQILTNLLHNAVKFTHQGMVEFGYEINQEMVDFYVRDTGIGISENAQKRIFERFTQADSTISSDYGGTGLGLSISKAFAEMLEGTLSVNSHAKEGSLFTLSLPFRPIVEQNSTIEPVKYAVPTRKTTILVAEDEIYNFQLLDDILTSQSYQILRAVNGQEVVDICKVNDKIDLVLMDIQMPVKDGLIALDELRQFRPDLPVIAQTAYALETDKSKFLSRGFNDYLSKPIKKGDLIQMVLKYV